MSAHFHCTKCGLWLCGIPTRNGEIVKGMRLTACPNCGHPGKPTINPKPHSAIPQGRQ